MIVVADDKAADWVANRIPDCERGFGACRAFAVIGETILAGVVFHNWSPAAGVIEVSAAAANPRWITRNVLSQLFAYAYDTCDCQAVVIRTPEDNERVRRLWRSFGASEHIIPRLRGVDAAECVMVLPRETWKASRYYKDAENG